jgi:hypothetical protein
MTKLKTFLITTILLMLTCPVWGIDKSKSFDSADLTWYSTTTGSAITYLKPSEGAYSNTIDMRGNTGYSGLQLQITSTSGWQNNSDDVGVVTLKAYSSNDGVIYVEPEGDADIFTTINIWDSGTKSFSHSGDTLTAISETGHFYSDTFDTSISAFMKIYIVETSGVSSVSITKAKIVTQ